ncbi:MAG: HEPN domain-containing protein, partial [Bacteroidetes bacterium]|nr:HEPN domain-containing protein [Bacteroidota bacterium]
MCHQTMEKGLKAYYENLHNEQPPYIHNLIRLAEKVGLYERM